jgi:hypothetical protein
MPTRYVLDRFEGDVAVLIADDGQSLSAPGLAGREGDVFRREGEAFLLCPDETAARREHARRKMDGIFGKKEKA